MKTIQQSTKSTRPAVLAMAAVLVCLSSVFAHADNIYFSIQSTAGTAGSTHNGLEVTITNSGSSAVNIGGFSFGVLATDSDITFTNITTGTVASYLFVGDSVFGPDITTPGSVPGQQISASDLEASGSGVSLLAGQSLGLGEVFFDVSATASTGLANVFLSSFPTSSLSDSSGVNLSIAQLNSGTIDISGGTTVPEPSSLLLLCTGIGMIVSRHREHS